MGSITLKDYYIEQFELTPAVIREHLVFLASDNFISSASSMESSPCCANMNKRTVEHDTKNGKRFTVECDQCGARSVMATTALLANLSWYQKFSTWESLTSNSIFKDSMKGFTENTLQRDEETQVYLLLELLAGLNVFNKIHDANKKRFDGALGHVEKTNIDAVSLLVRAAQKSVADKLDSLGASLKDAFTQRRLKGVTAKIVDERFERISLMNSESKNRLADIILIFNNCFQNDKAGT